MKIDAHQHFWQHSKTEFDYAWMDAPALAAIRRDFLPHDLKPLIEEVGVDYTVFVQTQHNVAENRWVLDMARQNDFLAGIVGWVDLASPQCEAQLEEFRDDPYFVGIRHITHDEPDDDFIVRPDVLAGLKVLEKHGVPFDLLFYARHLHHAPTLARALPNLPIVIDHISKPLIKDGKMAPWVEEIRAAAACDNIYCKLSGMITEADWANWTPNDLRPYVEIVLDAFGPNRCMFGSDWPVCELAGTYKQAHDALDTLIAELSDSEREAIFSGTATRFYNLQLGEASS